MLTAELVDHHNNDPMQLLEALGPEQLAAMPLLPITLEAGSDGTPQVQERLMRYNELPQRAESHLYRPNPIDHGRWTVLDGVAKQLGGAETDALQFFNQPVDGQAIQDNPAIPLFLKHAVPERSITTLEALRHMREAVLEQQYAEKVIGLARNALATYMPEALPHEPTAAVVSLNSTNTHFYYGRFGGQHVISFSASKRLSPEWIDQIDERDEAVLHAAHELAHQAASEREGRDIIKTGMLDTTPYNQETVTDPWEAFKLARKYMDALPPSTEAEKLIHKVTNIVHETIAYAAEEEVRVSLGIRSIFGGSGNVYFSGGRPAWVDAIEVFLGNADSQRRHDLHHQLSEVDLESISSLPQRILEGMINNPEEVLHLKKKTAA